MDQSQLNWLTNFIWNADDIFRDVYNRGKYRDVILPMTVLRRLDSVLEPTKQAVLVNAGVALDELTHIASSSPKSQRIKHKLFHGLLAPITGYTSAS